MKYMWSNEGTDFVNMHTGNGFVVNTDYKMNMMENQQRMSPKKVKRFRSAFTTDQVNYLEVQFKKFPYIGNAQRKEVALALNIPERAVKIWFQNRRMKEKKDMTGKEFDDEPSNRQSQEFAKDQLNNVGKPSVNDQQPYSLPLLIDANKTNSDETMMTNASCSRKTGLLIADSGFKAFEGTKVNMNSSPYFVRPRHPNTPNRNISSAEYSMNLCKKYKESNNKLNFDKPIVKEQEIKPAIDEKPKKMKSMEQMLPEDLSSRKVNVSVAEQMQVPNIIPNNPGYISVVPTVSPFYAQPYYTTGGVIWKPVNMVSTPSGTSIPPVIQESLPKKCCNCDCHVKPIIPYNFQQQSPSPQYIFTAVQYPNANATKY